MAASHGSKAAIKLGSQALPSTLVDYSTYFSNFTDTLTRDKAETTTFQKTSKTYITGLKDGTMSGELPLDAVIDQILWDIYNTGTAVNFEYYPGGIGAGLGPKYSGSVIIETYDVGSTLGDNNTLKVNFQITGDVTRVAQ